MPKVGFIGLGCMGFHMVNNLVKHGVKPLIYDVNPAAIKQLTSKGVKAGSSPADVAAQCDYIITMLPEGPDVYDTYTKKKGILELSV